MATFVVGAILALTGTFDHWTERYRLKQRRRRLIKDKFPNKNKGNISSNTTPYYSAIPDKKTTSLYKISLYNRYA
ncbi:hypothetical protein GCM10007352_27580 [Mucilaginibacter phyllosphaerae]|nr:hypothetical protein GCM10007352_27580 [Mucilaginibacter phyllosphaerae]